MNDKPFAPRTLAFLVAAAFAGHAQANTGRVEFVFGGATLRNAQGERPLVRGADLRTGDAVITTDGRAQIRFSDGAFVSLQPNTEFKIDEYKFDGQTDGSERGIFALAKGAMRTVTGLVGRVNRRNYEVRTPTATVGIRGTGGIISILLNGATLVQGTRGIWTLTNLAGVSLDIPAGRAGIAGTDQTQPPKETSQGPSAPPAPPTEQVPLPRYAKLEDPFVEAGFGNTGVPIGVVYNEVIGGTMELGVFETISAQGVSVTGNVGTSGQLSGFTVASSGSAFTLAFAGTLNESGSDGGGPAGGGVSWGRWTGPVTITSGSSSATVTAYGPNGGFHYAIGVPTAVMPTTGTFTYNLIGATAVTHQLESLVPGMVTSASFKGSFAPAGSMIGMDVYYTIGGSNWHLQTPGGGTCSPSISVTGNTFAGSGNWNYFAGGTCATCCSPCAAQITGGFAGTGATYAGVAYQGQIASGANSNAGGVLVFKK